VVSLGVIYTEIQKIFKDFLSIAETSLCPCLMIQNHEWISWDKFLIQDASQPATRISLPKLQGTKKESCSENPGLETHVMGGVTYMKRYEEI